MTNDVRDPLVGAVSELTQETTALLQEYRNAKVGIDGKVQAAADSATSASGSQAKANASELAAASSHKQSEAEANRAKSEADRAKEVSGLATVEQAVDNAMINAGLPSMAADILSTQALIVKAHPVY
ncbi:hypothetical protein GLP37_20375 [Photobacterium phosphoreum]|uniref:hypothetical protein n=1 Tax=Photobacterium phosphoreum TaxID=659 RepID=UPI001E3D0382|nr:hypothetical protein [Photobacterium phosphoreum]MCD9504522.1 hypothetical protein [Photobacterium phosphoreum]